MSDGDDLVVNRSLRIPRRELDLRFSTSGGPGGQHANVTASRVELRFDVERSSVLTASQRRRLLDRFGPVVRVAAADERSQSRNRAIAEDRLAARLADALRVRPVRRPTRPSKAAGERRIAAKRRRSEIKSNRRRPTDW